MSDKEQKTKESIEEKKQKKPSLENPEELLKQIKAKEENTRRIAVLTFLGAIALAIAGWGATFFYAFMVLGSKEEELIKIAKKTSERYIAVSPDGRLLVKANLIDPEKVSEIVKVFIAKETIFSEANVWYPLKAYPEFSKFLKLSPLISRWLNYFTEGDAKEQIISLASFLYEQGRRNNLPEYEYPLSVNFERTKVEGNHFKVDAKIELYTTYLDMITGSWRNGKTTENVHLEGYIDFSFADPVNNPYGIRITSFTVEVPLKGY